jgi:hypothetical protein
VAVIAILALLSIAVGAVGYEYTINASDDFATAELTDDISALDEVAQRFNMDTTKLHDYFKQNGLIYLAVSADKQTQVKISAFSDNFSTTVADISYLDETGLTAFANAIREDDDSPAQLIENNGRKYLCVKDTLSDSGGVYTVTQYITICNNKTFYFSGYNPGEDTSSEIDAMFKSFRLQETDVDNITDKYFIWINCGVVLFGAVAIVSIIGIIRVKTKAKKEIAKNED